MHKSLWLAQLIGGLASLVRDAALTHDDASGVYPGWLWLLS